MDEVKLALELNKVVHNECKDVPHDIGLRLLDVVKKHLGEQLNLPPVIKSVCDCMEFPRPLIIKDGEIYCTSCNAFISQNDC